MSQYIDQAIDRINTGWRVAYVPESDGTDCFVLYSHHPIAGHFRGENAATEALKAYNDAVSQYTRENSLCSSQKTSPALGILLRSSRPLRG
jgi:hypothetical protein